MLGKASKHHVLLVFTRILTPDMSAEWRTTAPTSCLEARSTVGTVPML